VWLANTGRQYQGHVTAPSSIGLPASRAGGGRSRKALWAANFAGVGKSHERDDVNRVVAARLARATSRKVRAPLGTLPGNAWANEKSFDGQCRRKQTAWFIPSESEGPGLGKGEKA